MRKTTFSCSEDKTTSSKKVIIIEVKIDKWYIDLFVDRRI
jgi:hypothetical protein